MTHTEDLIFRLRDTASRGVSSWGDLQQEAADELERLAQPVQPEQEPVVWMMPDGQIVNKWALQFYGGQAGKPLYATPPQRQWVGLTSEEIASIPLNEYTLQTAEKLLKGKNK